MACDPDAGGGERQATGGQYQHDDVPQGAILQQRQPVPAVQQGKEPAFGALVAVQFVQDLAGGGVDVQPGLVGIIVAHAPDGQRMRFAPAGHGVFGAAVVVEVVLLEDVDAWRVAGLQREEGASKALRFQVIGFAGAGREQDGLVRAPRGHFVCPDGLYPCLVQEGVPLQFTHGGRGAGEQGLRGGDGAGWLDVRVADSPGVDDALVGLEDVPGVHRHQAAEDPGEGGQREDQAEDMVPAQCAGREGRAGATAVGAGEAPADDAGQEAADDGHDADNGEPDDQLGPVDGRVTEEVEPVQPGAQVVEAPFQAWGVAHHFAGGTGDVEQCLVGVGQQHLVQRPVQVHGLAVGVGVFGRDALIQGLARRVLRCAGRLPGAACRRGAG